MNIFGNIKCEQCELETRFLHEGNGEELLLLGDKFDKEINFKSECDYCQKENTINLVLVDGIISAFLNEKEYSEYINKRIEIEKQKDGAGLEKEKNRKMVQMDIRFTLPYKDIPLSLDDILKMEENNWIVKECYKKENINKDSTERIENFVEDEFIYKINKEEDENEIRWLSITNMKKNNAVISQGKPYYGEDEVIYDISQMEKTEEILLNKKISENFELIVIKKLSGVNVLLYTVDENYRNLEYNGFEDTFEEAIKEIEELYSINI